MLRQVTKLTHQFDLVEAAIAIQSCSPRCGQTRVITIDGPAGSGKTTLAQQLSRELDGASVIHLDELYEGWENALGAELFERIHAWILKPIENGLPPKHLLFDWAAMAFTSWKEIVPTPVLIIEGVGSGHTSLRQNVAQAIWVEADEELLLDRVVQRDGELVREQMLNWQVRELLYFDAHEVKKFADIHFRGQ